MTSITGILGLAHYSHGDSFGGPPLEFFLNGELIKVDAADVDPSMKLVDFIRYKARLCGTKVGCGHGACGACTVVVRYRGDEHGRPVHACLTPLCAVHLCQVTTVEGLGSCRAPHAIQRAVAEHHGSQCGFCSPGFVMSIFGLLQDNARPRPTGEEVEHALAGNLCRCTGYRPILDAAKVVAGVEVAAPTATACGTGAGATEGAVASSSTCDKVAAAGGSWSSTHSPLPPLLALKQVRPSAFGRRKRWLVPTNLPELLELWAQRRSLASDATEVTLYAGNLGFRRGATVTISAQHVPELRGIQLGAGGAAASCSLGLGERLADVAAALAGAESGGALGELRRALLAFGSLQLRNASSLSAVLRNTEVTVALLALGAELELCRLPDHRGLVEEQLRKRKKLQHKPVGFVDPEFGLITQDMFNEAHRPLLGVVRAGPLGGPDCSISTERVTLDRYMAMHDSGELGDALPVRLIVDARGAFCRYFRRGLRPRGPSWPRLAACFVRNGPRWSLYVGIPGKVGGLRVVPLSATLHRLLPSLANGALHLTDEMLQAVFADVGAVTTPLHRHYEKALAASFLRAFLADLAGHRAGLEAGLPRGPSFAVQHFERCERGGMQRCLPARAADDTSLPGVEQQPHVALPASIRRAPVGLPLQHTTGLEQCTGEAVYVDDLPSPEGCLFGAFVLPPVPRARIKGVDFAPALRLDGVRDYFDYRDFATRLEEKAIPAENAYKPFTSGEVGSLGHCIGIVVAESQELADKAAKLVQVKVEELPGIFTVEDAVAQNSYFKYGNFLEVGDVEAALTACGPHVVEGEITVGGQEHFYLEPHAVLVVPGEGDEITVFSPTQCIQKTQKSVAWALDIPASAVTVRVKRMGGAFGGKEVLSTFMAARLAIAAKRLRRPVRSLLSRQEDLETSGQRHPIRARYRAGFDPTTGKLVAYDVVLHANGGHTESITKEIMSRALSHAHNAYSIPNFRAVGYCCKTNWHSFTAFRGFGAPQAMVVVDTAMECIALRLGKMPEEIREVNLMRSGEETPYRQVVKDSLVGQMWAELKPEILRRQTEVEAFNRAHRARKRGLAAVPTKYGIGFPVKFLNQSGALVMIYGIDGSILISHGGTEMGQGLNIKMVQIAAAALRCPVAKVRIADSQSDKIPNPSPTAASVGSDINGMAVLAACEKLASRLRPIRRTLGFLSQPDDGGDENGQELSTSEWEKLIKVAYFDRIDLCAEGFYATPDVADYDWALPRSAPQKNMYAYHTYGAALAEVELDCLTGEWTLRATRLLMDVGMSLNPAIDIGQVEGAFVQGLGMFTTEELHWADGKTPGERPGSLVTNNPHTYIIPGALDIPEEWHVTLWPRSTNEAAVHNSKAVGEPPMYLSGAVFFALKAAARAANVSQVEESTWASCSTPLTLERLRMLVKDDIVRAVEAVDGPYVPPPLA